MGIEIPKRFRCGKRKPATAAKSQTELEWELRQHVVSQPHRHGDRSVLAESELGRFIRDHVGPMHSAAPERYAMAIHGACIDFYRLVEADWRRRGVPLYNRIDEGTSLTALLLTIKDEEKRKQELLRVIGEREALLKRAGLSAFTAARNLIMFDMPVVPQLIGDVRNALQSLGIDHPI